MRTFLFLTFFLGSFAQADQKIALRDVASAFIWLKIAPNFPATFTSSSEDQLSFTVFDDLYLITREKKRFKVVKNNLEAILLDEITFLKIFKFVVAENRSEGVLNSDQFQESIQTQKIPTSVQFSQTVYQCKSDLPSRITQNGSVINQVLQHTWLQMGSAQSFGMPNTDEAGYFGGSAHIRSPDSFIAKGPKHLECAPVHLPSDQDEVRLSKKISCVAQTLSLPQDPIFGAGVLDRDFIAHFDYHALDRNCLMAVRFVLACSGANAAFDANAGIGGKFDWNDLYSVSEVPVQLKTSIMELQARVSQFRSVKSMLTLPQVANELMNQAMDLDSELRGVKANSSEPKSLREICELALDHCE